MEQQIAIKVQKVLDNGDVLLTNGVTMPRMLAVQLGLVEDAVISSAFKRGQLLRKAVDGEGTPKIEIGDTSVVCNRCGRAMLSHTMGPDGSPFYVAVNTEKGNVLRACDEEKREDAHKAGGCSTCLKSCDSHCTCGCHNVWVLGRNLEEYKRGVGRKDYAPLAEAFRRNIELGMSLLERRPSSGKGMPDYYVFSDSIRTEAEGLIKENLIKLRAMTT
jgi:hypothetical protein